ncbi:DUF3108 domain-containing protein [Marinomonas pollencensis]|uniref:Uncharacterized protein DUF3108 n=1 Tax=Marinomonas pollencensis TaxID=491954 RepID=A0A3E0DN33_9GAMM|nr:DUF3108 domain-containing protein [Marinomonas pollencensis]REG84159.1 uncharacterized protein DUF3108 [Marinomonas pollencensis]
MGIDKILITSIISLLALPILPAYGASSAKDSFLVPYSAVYSTVWKKGITVKVKGTQTLTRQADGNWHFSFTADNLFASLNEQSTFAVDQYQIVPSHYRYESSAFGKKRKAELRFDWSKMSVRNDVKNKPWSMSIKPKTVDKLSVQLQIREDLKQGKTTLNYLIADGGYTKNWRFKRLQTETIDTTLGRLEAIKVTRINDAKSNKQTSFWFAPSHDFLLVKLTHKEKDGDSYTLDIESLKTDPNS